MTDEAHRRSDANAQCHRLRAGRRQPGAAVAAGATLRVGAIAQSQSARVSERAVRQLGAGAAAESVGEMQAAECWLIGTGDDQVHTVARALAEARPDLDGALVFHLAGRFGLEVLAPLAEQGASQPRCTRCGH